MANELVRIEICISPVILAKLLEYQATHKLQLISHAVAAILVDFFDLSLPHPNSLSLEEEVVEIQAQIRHIELFIIQLVDQLLAAKKENADSRIANYSPDVFQTDEHDDRKTSCPQVETEDSNDSHSVALKTSQQKLKLNSNNSLEETEINPILSKPSVEELMGGVSGAMLVKRLQTNPTTLRKYLRENGRLLWAAQRDPDELGWLYDPLLQRYYPVRVNADGSITQLTGKVALPQNSKETFSAAAPIQKTAQHEPLQGYQSVEAGKGLSQTELAQLTGIPTNTLQRWKQRADCAERMKQRTKGRFIYEFSEPAQLFYPCIV